MQRIFALAIVLAISLALTARADDGAQLSWIKAQAVLQAAEKDLQTGGIMSLAAHAADLEQSLAGAQQAMADAAQSCVVLTDGPSDTLLSLVVATMPDKNAGTSCKQTQAVPNPYPTSTLFLGSFYDEVGKPEDALRVLDAGLAISSDFSAMKPELISERGAALQLMKRWTDALANYDNGLTIPSLEPEDHARLLRGRGNCLTELGRLDDAEKTYRESQNYDPNNEIARNELEYIARLRAGATPTPSQIIAPKS